MRLGPYQVASPWVDVMPVWANVWGYERLAPSPGWPLRSGSLARMGPASHRGRWWYNGERAVRPGLLRHGEAGPVRPEASTGAALPRTWLLMVLSAAESRLPGIRRAGRPRLHCRSRPGTPWLTSAAGWPTARRSGGRRTGPAARTPSYGRLPPRGSATANS